MTWRTQTEIENGNVPARILTEVEQRVRQDPTWVLFAIIDKARGGRCAQWPRSHMAHAAKYPERCRLLSNIIVGDKRRAWAHR